MRKQAAVAFARTQVLRRKTVAQTHIQTRTQAASLHLRNVTGLLLHSKPTGALNKHLFLPVNPPCLHHAAYTALPRHTNTPLSSLRSPRLLASLALLFLWHYPLKAIYTLTFGIQIKKRGQGEAERITVAYDSDSCFARSRATIMHLHTACTARNDSYLKFS